MNWYDRLGRWFEDHRGLVDRVGTALVVLVVVPLSVALQQVLSASYDFRRVGEGWVLVASLLVAVPLAVRRSRPVLSVVLVYAAVLLHQLLGIPIILPADLLVVVALFSVTVHGPVWAHRTAVSAALLGCATLGMFIALDDYTGPFDVIAVALFTLFLVSPVMLSAWAFGLVLRARRDTIHALRDRAQRLEVERDQQAKIATAAERARIAREMHDIVAHSLSVMIAQADGGRYMATTDPDAAARSLGTIAETGRAALGDMRRLLGVLRTGPDDGADDRDPATGSVQVIADLTPQPAASDIEALVAQVRSSNVDVSLVRMGTPRTLPPGTGLTLYRICQEALTNVLKHAGPDPHVTVLLTWERSRVTLQVDDDGRGASASGDGAGQGLLGMQERAAMFAGTVTAGPRPGGGFRVMLDLPLPEPRS